MHKMAVGLAAFFIAEFYMKGAGLVNDAEIKKVVAEVIKEILPTGGLNFYRHIPIEEHKPKKIEFSKKLIIGASIFYGLMCIVALVSWFLIGDWPREIIVHFSWPYGATAVSYMCKSAYENKPKILNRRGGEGK